jgi:hypothetical protein
MAIEIKHAKVSAKSDGVDSTRIQPSNWNANHVLTMATARLVGRYSSGAGAAQEISVGAGLTLSVGGVLSANGTSVDLSPYAQLAGAAFTGNVSVGGTFGATGAATFAGIVTLNRSGSGSLILNQGNNVGAIHFKNASTTYGQLGANSTYPLYSSSGAGTALMYVDTSGNLTAAANVTAYSDRRLKTDIETITDALDKIERMRGVSYVRKDSGAHRVGVIAQEVKKVVPEVVHRGEKGILAVSYGDLVGVLIEAVKELSARVRDLEART